MVVPCTAGGDILGLRSLDLGALVVSSVPTAPTAASMAAAAHHHDHAYAEHQPKPVLRKPFHDFSQVKKEWQER